MNTLASYALDPEDSRGRLHEASSSPTRSVHQRDRDRIIHSTAFRRLQYKTQVFLHHEGSHFRTRLTHSLEVSQIARSIARSLHLNEDLAEAIALAHDLGHTPFGHAGERALDRVMEPWGGFDHNLQALRTVMILENRYAAHDGMNLSWETLEGLLKHNGPVPASESKSLNFVPEAFDLQPQTHATLEAQAAAIADDIAYNAHDIDDAVRAGLIEPDQLLDLPLAGAILREIREEWPDLDRTRVTHEIQRRLLTRTIEDVIETSTRAIAGAAVETPSDVRRAGETLIRFSPEVAAAESEIKAFLFANVYRAPEVMTPVSRSEKVVAALFTAYMRGNNVPGRWAERFEAGEDDRARARTISDFIAGMTDPYALDEYQRLFDDRPEFG